MTVHRWRSLYPADAHGRTLDDFYADAPEGVRVNMVSSLDGAAAFDGRVRPLSNPADHRLLRSLRAYCDVLLVGAGTVRAERYGPITLDAELRRYRREQGYSSLPPVAVVTGSGNLDWSSALFTAEGPRPIVVTTAQGAARCGPDAQSVADMVVAGDGDVDPVAMIEGLRDRGLRRVLCEGGPALLSTLVARDLVDDMCFTLSPTLAGPQPISGHIAAPALEVPQTLGLRHVLLEGEHLYMRYQRLPSRV
ncbi:pyrimidine reductase family protein [Rhodococcus qingshengii]|uniref:pyrimidine reductase family protein n=1 Tax=Rhodococcus qingshengii TaxID=334542 RepID=UPI001BE89768|nr:pyrimidine reductase family protein [Rhodococcus qingshengii]MBT2274415.1 pyrimidine reductase family protein [Rhodococcus qingshengii]